MLRQRVDERLNLLWPSPLRVFGGLGGGMGCRWVLLGHWEVRRHLGDDDGLVNLTRTCGGAGLGGNPR